MTITNIDLKLINYNIIYRDTNNIISSLLLFWD